MQKEELKKAREVFQALIILAEFLEETESSIVSKLAFFDDEKFQKIKEVVNLVNDWNSKSIKEKAEFMGFSYQEKDKNGYEISTVLS